MKKLQREAHKHYQDMMTFGKLQPKNDEPDSDIMYEKIKQDWFADSCSYCDKYFDMYVECECGKCPLNLSENKSSKNCCNGLWIKMSDAKTWKTWLKYAEMVDNFILERG